MSTTSTLPPPALTSHRDVRLRWRGVAIFIFVLVEILLGNELALAGSPYPPIFLVLHVLVALGLVVGAAVALGIALRLPSPSLQAIVGFTFLASLGATISGTVFLVAGQSDTALLGMEVLGGLALLGALLMIILGSVLRPPALQTTSPPA